MKRMLKMVLVCVLVMGMLAGVVAGAAEGSAAADSFEPIIEGVRIVDIQSWFHTLALDDEGHVWAWGQNQYGQWGVGVSGEVSGATHGMVKGLSDVVQVQVSMNTSYALRADGTVWAWGQNSYRKLGDGTTVARSTPIRVQGLNDVQEISAGNNHCLALKDDGTVWAWGQNAYGQVGNGQTISPQFPVQVEGIEDIATIAAGNACSLALKKDGTVWAWGIFHVDQLGNGPGIDYTRPQLVVGLNNIVQIDAGGNHALALNEDGAVMAWGYNTYGQLGDGTQVDRTAPIRLTLDDIEQILAGTSCSFAVGVDGTRWAWGYNNFGQLVLEDTADRHMPTELYDGSVFSLGRHVTFLARADGSIWGCGLNSYSQIRMDEPSTNVVSPILLFGPGSYVGPGIDPVDPPDPATHTVTVIERFLDGSPDITSTYDVTDGDPFAGTYASTGTIKSFNVSAANAEVHADFEDRTLSIAKVDRDITITLVFGESGTVTPPGQNEIAVLTVDSLTSTINQGSNTITFNVPVQDLTNGRIEGDITDLWAGSDTIVFIIADGTEHPRQLGDLVYINDGDQVYVTNDKIYTIIINVVGDPQPSPYRAASAPDDEAAPASEASAEPPASDPDPAASDPDPALETDIAEPEEPETLPEP